jgi:hypothetical protein
MTDPWNSAIEAAARWIAGVKSYDMDMDIVADDMRRALARPPEPDARVAELDAEVARLQRVIGNIRRRCFDDSQWGRYIDRALRSPEGARTGSKSRLPGSPGCGSSDDT